MDDFTTSVGRLLNQVGHWEQSRWSVAVSAGVEPSATAGSSSSTRADTVHALVQRLADLAADAEGGALRTVPRLGDLLLPDQLRVMSGDLLAAAAPEDVLKIATAEVDTTRRSL